MSDSYPSCSFCGKGKDSIEKLISGPDARICNECVMLSSRILREEGISLERTSLLFEESDLALVNLSDIVDLKGIVSDIGQMDPVDFTALVTDIITLLYDVVTLSTKRRVEELIVEERELETRRDSHHREELLASESLKTLQEEKERLQKRLGEIDPSEPEE